MLGWRCCFWGCGKEAHTAGSRGRGRWSPPGGREGEGRQRPRQRQWQSPSIPFLGMLPSDPQQSPFLKAPLFPSSIRLGTKPLPRGLEEEHSDPNRGTAGSCFCICHPEGQCVSAGYPCRHRPACSSPSPLMPAWFQEFKPLKESTSELAPGSHFLLVPNNEGHLSNSLISPESLPSQHL